MPKSLRNLRYYKRVVQFRSLNKLKPSSVLSHWLEDLRIPYCRAQWCRSPLPAGPDYTPVAAMLAPEDILSSLRAEQRWTWPIDWTWLLVMFGLPVVRRAATARIPTRLGHTSPGKNTSTLHVLCFLFTSLSVSAGR